MAQPDDPFDQAIQRLRGLFREARQRDYGDPSTAMLATASTDARPAVRAVTIVAIDDGGPVFFTDTRSGKGHQLTANPVAALGFLWPALGQQVNVEGTADFLDDDHTDAYWAGRPHEQRLAAWIADTPPPQGSDDTLEARLQAVRRRFGDEPAPRPPDWRAIRLAPDLLHFWKLGWRRLHTRERYYLGSDGRWHVERTDPLSRQEPAE